MIYASIICFVLALAVLLLMALIKQAMRDDDFNVTIGEGVLFK